MKNNIKEDIRRGILFMSIFYIIVIISLFLINLFSAKTTIDLNTSDDVKNTIKDYKTKVSSVNNTECKTNLNKMMNYIEKTTYSGTVKIKDIYKDMNDTSFLSFFKDIKESCDLEENAMKEKELPVKFITATRLSDNMIEPFMHPYEISFKDGIRELTDFYAVETDYTIKKRIELEIMRDILDLVE